MARQGAEQVAEISYSQFRRELANDNVKKIVIKGIGLKGEFRTKTKLPEKSRGMDMVLEVTEFSTVLLPIADPAFMPELTEKKVELEAISTEKSQFASVLLYLLPWLLIIGVW